jgi:hypothetical protein
MNKLGEHCMNNGERRINESGCYCTVLYCKKKTGHERGKCPESKVMEECTTGDAVHEEGKKNA